MFTSTTSVYSVNKQARSLCSQRASKEKNRFITGTCSLHEENEIVVIEYKEESNLVEAVSTYKFDNKEVVSTDSSTKDPSLIVISDQVKDSFNFNVSLYKMPNQSLEDIDKSETFSDEPLDLEIINNFEKVDNSIQSLSWNKFGDHIMSTSTTSVSLYEISDNSVKCVGKLSAEDGLDINIDFNWNHGVSAWDPHSSHCIASSFSNTLHIIDTKQLAITQTISDAHSSTIRDIDYNPNKPLTLITASEDRSIKFWDLRKTKEPVKTLNGHSHWVWSAKYNPFHDQLLASGGSDSIVNLWRIASCSSSPWLDSENNEEQSDDPADVKVKTVDQHEDSVYGISWSSADAWIYATLSFDGRIVLNHVPSTEKYKILL